MDRSEPHYQSCREILERERLAPVIPSPVLVEVDHLMSSRARSPVPFTTLLADIARGAYRVEDLIVDDYVRIAEILHRFADFNLGFVDAAVLAVVERLNEPVLATLDRRHFSVLRPRHVEALKLVPEA